MPEPPDFKALAYRVASINCESSALLDDELLQHPDALDDTIAILKEIWNARGAADSAAVADRLSTLTGWITSEPYRQHLAAAITDLDR